MTPPDRAIPSPRPGLRAMTSDLRNRLLILLVLPLCALALVGVWLDYRSADEAAGRHDQRLLRLLPALADSVLAPSIRDHEPPLLLLAPPVEDFLRQNTGFAGYSVRDISGRLLLGDDWVHSAVPTTHAPEFHSVEFGGVTYRVAVQRGRTGAGELVVALADGSDPRQQWAQQLLLRVLLPNLVLVAAAALAIHWAVGRAFKPLVDLAEAVEHRSPRDLSPIDEASSPAEVRPLVHSLNRLFALVNAQAEGQRRFVADAAHQLRTPLAGLQAQVEAWAMMAKAAAPPRVSLSNLEGKLPLAHDGQAKGAIVLGVDQIEKLRNATRRTSQLAHQLLALSRADARSLIAMMTRLSGEPATMWGPSIIGYGSYDYTYDSGHSGTMCRAGFSPRKAALTLYLMGNYGNRQAEAVCLCRDRIEGVAREQRLTFPAGLVSVVVDEDPAARRASGLIGVQVHVGPPMKVEYRNFLLKTLPVIAPAPTK